MRLRAQVLRLSNQGSNISAIAAYTGRGRASIARDLDRWGERGLEGLADGKAPGNPPRITEEAKAFLREKLSEEERTWNATQLAEALWGRFAIELTPRPSVSTSSRWATRGSARATYRTNRRTPRRSARPAKNRSLSKRGSGGRDHTEVPR